MEIAFRIGLLITGIINCLPSILAFSSEKLASSYGVQITDANLELLLRHRAVLFAIVGGLMIFSALTKKHYSLAVVVGLVSMLSFLVLAKLVNGDINPALQKVVKIDLIAIIVLVLSAIPYYLKS